MDSTTASPAPLASSCCILSFLSKRVLVAGLQYIPETTLLVAQLTCVPFHRVSLYTPSPYTPSTGSIKSWALCHHCRSAPSGRRLLRHVWEATAQSCTCHSMTYALATLSCAASLRRSPPHDAPPD